MKRSLIICAILITQILTLPAQTKNDKVSPPKKQESIHYKKKMTPAREDFLDKAPIQFSQEIVIDAPISRVWEIVDDSPGFTNWFPGVKWAKMEIETEKGVGAKRLAQYKSSKYYEEIIAYEQEAKWGFTMLESNSGMLKTVTEVISLEKVDKNTTKVIVKGGYEAKGIVNLMKGIVQKSVAKTWKNALNGLKEYAEAS